MEDLHNGCQEYNKVVVHTGLKGRNILCVFIKT